MFSIGLHGFFQTTYSVTRSDGTRDMYGSFQELFERHPSPPVEPSQYEISYGRLIHYVEVMQAGLWKWDQMFAPTPEGLVYDPIKILNTPSGRQVIDNGHHRVVAARFLGIQIPPIAFSTTLVSDEMGPPIPWSQVSLLLFDLQGFYPVLTPPPLNQHQVTKHT